MTDVAVEAVYVLEESTSNQSNEADGTKMSTSQESAAAHPSPRYFSFIELEFLI